MIELRQVEPDRYEVFAHDRHWEAFVDPAQAMREAEQLAKRIEAEDGTGPVSIHLELLPAND